MANNYRMIWNGNTTDLAWQYDLEMHSYPTALEFAKRHAIRLNKELVLWYQHDDGDWRPLHAITPVVQTWCETKDLTEIISEKESLTC